MAPEAIGNRYLVARALGAGGMARVFLCWDSRLEVWCAVKVMAEWLHADLALRHRFVVEARTLARVVHPHVVRIYDVVDDVASPYLVTEYLDGGSLEDLDRIHPAHAARVCGQVGRALHAAHDAGVIHRDVKPGNILLDRSGVARLGDFGLALLAEGGRHDGAPAGTIGYMPPEQRAGQASARSDLFALGAVLYAIVAGEDPDVLRRPGRDEAIDRLPEDLRPIVRRATNRQPADRYATAEELAHDLEIASQRLSSRFLGELTPTHRPPPSSLPDRSLGDDLDLLVAGTVGGVDGDKLQTIQVQSRGRNGVVQRRNSEPELQRSVDRFEVPSRLDEALLRAGRVLDRVAGSGIPTVLGVGRTTEGGRWLTLSRPRGERLDALSGSGPPSRRAIRLLPLARQVCAIVGRAHAQGVAHGGLGPDVVWVVGDKVELITGWGGARGLLGLADPEPDALAADTRALGALLAWCGASADPVADAAARAASSLPDARALERELVRPRPARRSYWLLALGGLGISVVGSVVASYLAVSAVIAWSRSPPPPPALELGSRQEVLDQWWSSQARPVSARPLHMATPLRRAAVVGGEVFARDADGEVVSEVGSTISDGAWLGDDSILAGSGRPSTDFPNYNMLTKLAVNLIIPQRLGRGEAGARYLRTQAVATDAWLVLIPPDSSVLVRAPTRNPRAVALSDTDVAIADAQGQVVVWSLTSPGGVELPTGVPAVGLDLDHGLTVIRSDATLERWVMGPPWRTLTQTEGLHDLTALGPGEVFMSGANGGDLGRFGWVVPCGARAQNPCPTPNPKGVYTDALGGRWTLTPAGLEHGGSTEPALSFDLADGRPVGTSAGVRFDRALHLTAGPVSSVEWVKGTDLVLTGDQAGWLTGWTASGAALGRVHLPGPIVAVGAIPGAVFVGLDDGQVVEIEPGLLDLLAGMELPALGRAVQRSDR